MTNDQIEEELVEQCADVFKKSPQYSETADLSKKDCKKLLSRAEKVFRKNPHNARTLGMCAMVYDTLRRTDEAIMCLEKILMPEAKANSVLRRRTLIYIAVLKGWPTDDIERI
tara:strand:+ start:217 stop:555 length:339 start_codon:yes stop_codon:yes gene_type:complete